MLLRRSPQAQPDRGPKCARCRAPIESTYFEFAGQTRCPACAERIQREQSGRERLSVTGGLLYGAAAAMICSAGYAAVTFLTSAHATTALLVGSLVGLAVRNGHGGPGNWRVAVVAVVFTYSSLMLGYVPLWIHQRSTALVASETARVEGPSFVASAASPLRGVDAESASGRNPLAEQPGANDVVGGTVTRRPVKPISIPRVSPVILANLDAILGLLFVAGGLMMAWKVTSQEEDRLVGPFELVRPATEEIRREAKSMAAGA